MTNKQRKILEFIYDSPKTVDEIKEKFKLNDTEMLNIFKGDAKFYDYYDHFKNKNGEEVVIINNAGKTIVENIRTERLHTFAKVLFSVLSLAISIILSLKQNR